MDKYYIDEDKNVFVRDSTESSIYRIGSLAHSAIPADWIGQYEEKFSATIREEISRPSGLTEGDINLIDIMLVNKGHYLRWKKDGAMQDVPIGHIILLCAQNSWLWEKRKAAIRYILSANGGSAAWVGEAKGNSVVHWLTTITMLKVKLKGILAVPTCEKIDKCGSIIDLCKRWQVMCSTSTVYYEGAVCT